ncbi:hypothetical protein [Bradyrhizobium sp. JR3.5]
MRKLGESKPVQFEDRRRGRKLRQAGGAGIVLHRDPRRFVGEGADRGCRSGQTDLDIVELDTISGDACRFRLAEARRRQAGNLDADRGLCRRLGGDVRNRQGAALGVESDLAVARLGAGGTDLLEGGLDVARDPALGIEVETEVAAGRDDCDGDQAEQNFLHSVNSGSSRKKIANRRSEGAASMNRPARAC